MPHISPYNPGLGHDLRNQYSTEGNMGPFGYSRPPSDWRAVTGPVAHPGWLNMWRGITNPANTNPFSRYLNPSTGRFSIEGGPQFSFPFPWLDQSRIASDRAAISNVINSPNIPVAANIAMGPSAWKAPLTPATTMAAPPNIYDSPPPENFVPDPLQWHTGSPFVNPYQITSPQTGPMPVPFVNPADIATPQPTTEELINRTMLAGGRGGLTKETIIA